MSISFLCRCGKTLRAPEEEAGRLATCPSCGARLPAPVVVRHSSPCGATAQDDSKSANAAEEDGPVFFRVRNRHVDPNRYSAGLWVPLEGELKPALEDQVNRRRKRARRLVVWHLESHWYQCLAYPLRAWPLIVLLGTGVGLFGVFLAAVSPRLGEVMAGPTWSWALAAGAPGAVCLVYAVSFLHCVLLSAAAGEYLQVRWPGRDVWLIARSWLTWGGGFLCGPALYAFLAGWYWLAGGDLDAFDKFIMLELAIVCAGYWLLAVVAAAERGTCLAGPPAIAILVSRLGWRIGPIILAALAVVYYCGGMLSQGIEEYHRNAFLGGMIASCGAIAGMYALVVLFRYTGLLAYRTRLPARSRE